MYNLFNFVETFIYDAINVQNWLFNPIDLGALGYMTPISMLGISTLLLVVTISAVRLFI